MFTLIPFLTKKVPHRYTGSVTEVPNIPSAEGNKTGVGTEITLFLNEESLEFANEYRAREVIEKYCSFMPTEIFLTVENKEPEYETIDESELKEDDVSH